MKKYFFKLAAAIMLGAMMTACGSSDKATDGLTFETYEKNGDATLMKVDIPQGDEQKVQSVTTAIREIMNGSQIAEEFGELKADGTLKEVIDSCVQSIDPAITSGEYGPIQALLFIENSYLSDVAAVFDVADGVYGMGSPDYYECVVRLSDGHIMTLDELTTIKTEDLEAIVRNHFEEPDNVNLIDSFYCLIPATADSCRVKWEISRAYRGDALIPLAEIEQYLTPEAKEMFKATPIPLQKKQEEAENDTQEETEVSEAYLPGRGDLGELRGPVKEVKYAEWSCTYNEQGQLTHENGQSLKSIFPGGITRDENGRLKDCNADGYGSRSYTYNDKGLPTAIYESGEGSTYVYDDDGYVVEETATIAPEMGDDEGEPETIKSRYTIIEKDDYGNWTKRKDQNGNVVTRTITYY